MNVAIWRQVVAALAASMTGLSAGLAYGWSTPALPQLLKPESIIPVTSEESSWIIICIEIGCALTSLPAGFVIDKIGRRSTLLLCSIPYATSWILTIFTRSVTLLFVSRLIQGACMGFVACASPIYISEISQPSIRGMLNTMTISVWFIGLILAFIIGTYTSYNATAYISLFLSVAYVIPLYFQAESPYYYVLKHRMAEATKSLSYYRHAHPSDLKEEIKSIEDYAKDESSNKSSFSSLFTDPVSFRCLLIMQILSFTTIFTGITATYVYATEIFSKTSGGTISPEEYSIILSVLLLIVNLTTSCVIDKIGRRPLVVVSCIGCFFSNLFAAAFFYVTSKTDIDTSSFHWVPLIVVGGYCIFVSVGLNPLTNSFQGEIFPANTRSVASGFNSFALSVMSSACLKLHHIVNTTAGVYFNFLIFTVVAGFGGVVLYFYMPETKNKTFNQIQKELNRKYRKVDIVEKELMEPINKPNSLSII